MIVYTLERLPRPYFLDLDESNRLNGFGLLFAYTKEGEAQWLNSYQVPDDYWEWVPEQ